MKRILAVLFLIVIVASLGSAEETSFRRVRMPNLKGKRIKSVLTFSDNDKAVEVHPAKGAAVSKKRAEAAKKLEAAEARWLATSETYETAAAAE